MTGCEALAGAALFACLARDPVCLPDEHRHLYDDLAAIAEQESGHNPRAIRDEHTGESLFPATLAEAVRIATERDALGHVIGLGFMQITHRSNWRRHGLTIASALDGCRNLRAGAAHYAGNLQRALARLRPAATQDYNSGRLDGAPAYAAAVQRRLAAGPLRVQGTSPSPVLNLPPRELLLDDAACGAGRMRKPGIAPQMVLLDDDDCIYATPPAPALPPHPDETGDPGGLGVDAPPVRIAVTTDRPRAPDGAADAASNLAATVVE